jgi:hypothetical protein
VHEDNTAGVPCQPLDRALLIDHENPNRAYCLTPRRMEDRLYELRRRELHRVEVARRECPRREHIAVRREVPNVPDVLCAGSWRGVWDEFRNWVAAART